MKIIKKNEFILAILAIAIVMLFLGSVSAAEDIADSNLTVNGNSQYGNVVIDEINEINADDINSNSENNIVGVNNKNDDDKLGSSTEFELRDKDSQSVGTASNPILVGAGKTVTVQFSAVSSSYDSFYLKMSENNNDVDNYGSSVVSGFSGSEPGWIFIILQQLLRM